MKRYILIILILLSPLTALLQADNLTSPLISIVPRPTHIVPGSGNFTFSARTVFAVENQEQAVIVRNFIDLFTRAAGITPALNVGSKEGQVRFVTDSSLKTEAYLLEIVPEQILIKASDTKGFFYALQSIRQLLPAAIESEQPMRNVAWNVPAMTIQDEPRFGFRGLLLDPVRCFIPKENVLRIIDCMAMLKINKLHFHLTDDNGWRIEIKKYPRLTEVGAWRVDHTDVPFHSRRNPERGEPTPIGGFYTQEEIREIVAYAADRQIEVIPEIDVPAHRNSALAAYPQFACPVVKDFIGVLPGLGGRNSEIIYCAGNDSVFTFLQDVFDAGGLPLFQGAQTGYVLNGVHGALSFDKADGIIVAAGRIGISWFEETLFPAPILLAGGKKGDRDREVRRWTATSIFTPSAAMRSKIPLRSPLLWRITWK